MKEDNKKLPLEDGITHINVYTKGATEIGRKLTNLSYSPFTHPEYGKFNSVEGLWYWLKTNKKFDELKLLYGFKAKKKGQELFESIKDSNLDFYENIIDENFKEEIKIGIRLKLKAENAKLLKELCKTDLPLKHYYYYGEPDNANVKLLEQYDWIMEELERLREITKEVIKKKV